jgi:hypothetical protein
MRTPFGGALLLGLLLSGGVSAAHVTDKLAVGLYESADAEQPIRLLTSGIPVERLVVNGQYCRVRLGDGEEGWLECRYITDEKPARAMLLEAQAGAAALRRDLAQAREQLQAGELEREHLLRRLQAAERLFGGALPEPETLPQAAETVDEPLIPEPKPGAESSECTWFCWLPPVLTGLSIGLLMGGGWFFWRCRRRYGGLRI